MSWDSDYQKWRSDTGLPEQEVKTKPELIRQPLIKELNEQPYDRYLPNAFDESLSLVEKVNKVVHSLNQFAHLINEGSMIENKIIELTAGLKEDIIQEIGFTLGDIDDGSLDNPGSGVNIDGGVL